MIRQSDIDSALAAAKKFELVETADELEAAGRRWRQKQVLGIDTEFIRERTYRADLGLVQVSDGDRVWLVDPLKTGPLESVKRLCEHAGTLKVLHAPSEDIAVLAHAAQSSLMPLFDTQIACAMLGQPLQMSYHKVAEWLLQVHIDKGETRSRWLRRPLRPAQLKYAALDVCLLPLMQQELAARLQAMGRADWLREDCQRLLDKSRAPAHPGSAWKRISGANRLDPAARAVLRDLARWREKEAERSNMARGFVVKDTALIAIARQQPANEAALAALDVLHPAARQRYGKDLLNVIAKARGEGRKIDPPEPLTGKQRKILAAMRKRVQQKASELSVDPALLASRRDLESLLQAAANAALPERFNGWRRALITDDLLALKAGAENANR